MIKKKNNPEGDFLNLQLKSYQRWQVKCFSPKVGNKEKMSTLPTSLYPCTIGRKQYNKAGQINNRHKD